jgi:hypothetical protein
LSSDRAGLASQLRVLYVAGYGRSGSTLLSTVLGGHPDLVSAGELSFLPEDWSVSGRVCSCGEPYPECPHWRALPSQVADIAEWARQTRTIEKAIRVRPASREHRQAYARDWRAALAWSPGGTEGATIVDSSKTAWATLRRPLALANLVRAQVVVVHLVRDVYATLESVTRTGSNWELEGRIRPRPLPAVRAVAGWVVANLGAEIVGRALGRGRYLRVRYEDFLADPALWIGRIGNLIDIPLEELGRRVADGESIPVGHVAGGNRMRFGGEVRLEVRAAKPGRLGPRHRVMCMVGAGWLRRVYGYGRPR